MVTAVPGIALGVLAADCAPVLFADPEARDHRRGAWRLARRAGRSHGGDRRGDDRGSAPAPSGSAPASARASPSPPTRSGRNFTQSFAAADPENRRFFRPAARSGHFLFDLPGYIADRLARLGLAAVERTPHDTAAEEELFFSYRRACLRGESDYGRGLAAIALAP